MITSRERVLRTLKHQHVDHAPRDLWPATAVETHRGDELAEMRFRYASDLVRPDFRYPKGLRTRGATGEPGESVDAWGCVWRVDHRGARAVLERPAIAEAGQIDSYQPPWELLEKLHLSAINRSAVATSRFVLAVTHIRPFERLQALLGDAAARGGLAHGTKPVRNLLDMLHDFYAREIDIWSRTEVDGVAFGDDWVIGPDALPLDAWRGLLRPMYHEFAESLREKDKCVFFRGGHGTAEVLDELSELGIDALHGRWRTGFDRLASARNHVALWCGLADPDVLVRGRPEDVRAAVRQWRTAFDFGAGGVVAQCPWEHDAPFDNVAAFFSEWLAPLPANAHAR